MEEETSMSSNRINELLDKNQSLKAELTELNNSILPSMAEQSGTDANTLGESLANITEH